MKITTAPDIAPDSPMEALFYGLCYFHEVPAERVMLSAAAERGGQLWYWPGFCVAVPGSLALYAEVSDGQHESVMRPLRTSWRASTPHRLAVLYRDELHVLMTRANSHAFMEQLKIWAR
jgi:hypothetical protein